MKSDESMESRIQQAMKSRLQHFKDQADSLTFEGVRRLLEKDMVLDTHALDSHKKFVKQLLEKYLSGAEEDDESKGKDVDKSNGSAQIKLDEEPVKDSKVEDSPVMGLLSDTQGNAKDKIPTEDMIKEAIWNKATYFQSKSEELTLGSVRRLLEGDLELQKFSLDSFKKLISKQLDEVLNSQSNNDDANSSPSNTEGEVKPKKKLAVKEKVQKSEVPKKRKKPAQETEKPRKKKTRELSVEKNNGQDQSSDESSGVKREVVAPVYGKKVERLKSIIKACGMTVAPTVYKKAKQAPEDKREAILIKELKEILSKEGLSSDPSEKDMAILRACDKHNICAYLDSSTKYTRSYADIITFLQRSRIHYAISTRYDAYKSHQLVFWRSAKLDERTDPPVIRGNIRGHEISISAADIRRVLHFGDEPKDPILLNKFLVRGCFLRMKYNGNINRGNFNKAHLCPQFKYLMHVLIHCLGPRKGGFDSIRETLQSAMVALVLNRPYNFSGMIFQHMAENLTRKRNEKFLMYPRFLQMVFDEKLPDLPKADADKIVFEHMTDMTLHLLNIYRDKVNKPPVRRLFGHPERVDYVAPVDRRWRHDDSDSDVENIVMPDDSDDDQAHDNGQGGDVADQNVRLSPPQPQPDPEQQSPPAAETTETAAEQLVENEFDKTESERKFEHVLIGSRLVTRKRRLASAQGVDYRPDSSRADDTPAPSPPKKKARAKTSKVKGRKKRFEIVRRTPTTHPAVTPVITSAAATSTVSIPMSTTAVQSSDVISQAFARLSKAFAGPSIMSVNPATLPIATGISAPLTITFSPMPANTAGESSHTSTLSLQDQINNLNNLVKMLMDKCSESEKQIIVLMEDNKQAHNRIDQLQSTVGKCSQKIVKLEEENLKSKATVDELLDKIAEFESGGDDNDKGDEDGDDCAGQ